MQFQLDGFYPCLLLNIQNILKSQQLSATYKVKTPQRGVQGIDGAAHLSRLSAHLPSH